MSKWRKHVTAGGYVDPPEDGQQIVQAVGSRGSNLIEVKLAGGEQTLCMLPAKFNKKLWVKRGGYLVIEHGCVDTGGSVTGTIVSVLYDADVRHLKSLPGVWPSAFADTVESDPLGNGATEGISMASVAAALPSASTSEAATSGVSAAPEAEKIPAVEADCAASQTSAYSESDSDLPPLEQNTNRPIREYEYTDDETTDED